nr:MAG TPA: hypothetical protein [Caudoviricetes sp.]
MVRAACRETRVTGLMELCSIDALRWLSGWEAN